MRKTLLIAASALAASVISSQAGVYSQNIVGYVNQPVGLGFVNMANPLDINDPGTGLVNNSITNILSTLTGTYDGAGLYIWNGHGFTQYTIDSGQPTGVGNAGDSAPVLGPTLNTGTGWFLNNNTGVAETNTFAGTVHVDAAATGSEVVGQTTNIIVTGFQFYASSLAVGGGAGTVLQIPVSSGNLDGSGFYVPNIVGGAVHGYTQYTIDSGQTPSYFGNAGDSAEVPEPQIPVGSGFLINNNTGAAVTWVQAY
jgi:hypothetical protein